MAARTRFGLDGYGVRRAGSFAGKHMPVVVPTPGERTVYVGVENRAVYVGAENRAVAVLAESRTVYVPTES